MKKNLIIGGFTNYEINQLKPWVLSASQIKDNNTDIVLLSGKTSQKTIDWLNEQGVITVPMKNITNLPIHVLRFLHIYDYLKEKYEEYEFVVTTDVKDVYFQTNPFQYIETNNDKKLIVASEGLRYRDEFWGDENLMQSYGPYVYDEFKNNEIYNVGTFGGKSEYVKDMVFNIFTNAINRPIPICDQAVFNVLINTQPFRDVIKYSNDWACELGTMMDPSKIESFRPNLLFNEPIWKDGQLFVPCTETKLFSIVHQYDRVPELKKFVQKKYEQEDETQFFIYKT